MNYLKLEPFNPVANGVRSTTKVPKYAMTLGRVVLAFLGANSITKATISEVVVKIGARVVFGPISGTQLDKLNKYRGIYDDAAHLTIDLTERDGLSVFAKEVGGIDLMAIGNQEVFIEVVNTAAAGTPSLYAIAGFTALQFDGKSSDGQLIKKVLRMQLPSSGGTRNTWTPDFRGAYVQRIHFEYAGADWGAAANGNINTVEVKKNGVAVWDRIACLDNRFVLQEHKKVPQSKWYSLDFIHDNVNSAALATADARALEFNFELTATDTIVALCEVLDMPNNL